ncbi:MAG: YbbC/YhhH family protein [Limisphaerales bacterium]
MRKTPFFVGSAAVLFAIVVAAAEPAKHSAKPKEGFVPDAKTAIKIAVAVWDPIYGRKEIAREKPYRAHLDTNGVWIVEGSLPNGWFGSPVLGGVAIAEIAKSDGRILRVSHGK